MQRDLWGCWVALPHCRNGLELRDNEGIDLSSWTHSLVPLLRICWLCHKCWKRLQGYLFLVEKWILKRSWSLLRPRSQDMKNWRTWRTARGWARFNSSIRGIAEKDWDKCVVNNTSTKVLLDDLVGKTSNMKYAWAEPVSNVWLGCDVLVLDVKGEFHGKAGLPNTGGQFLLTGKDCHRQQVITSLTTQSRGTQATLRLLME